MFCVVQCFRINDIMMTPVYLLEMMHKHFLKCDIIRVWYRPKALYPYYEECKPTKNDVNKSKERL